MSQPENQQHAEILPSDEDKRVVAQRQHQDISPAVRAELNHEAHEKARHIVAEHEHGAPSRGIDGPSL